MNWNEVKILRTDWLIYNYFQVMYNLSCVTWAAPACLEKLIYREGPCCLVVVQKMFTYAHTKHQIIKYGMVSCYSQAIN